MWESVHHNYGKWDAAPNAALFYNNSIFDMIRRDDVAYLTHITLNLEKIEQEGVLFPSAGCLIGSIYCTPAYVDGGRLRLHNLGAYYFLEEARGWSSSREGSRESDISILVLRITRPAEIGRTIEGPNYLRMGNVHFDSFHNNYHLSDGDFEVLQRKIVDCVRAEQGCLRTTIEEHKTGISDVRRDMESLTRLGRSVGNGNIPFFGYVLFESLCVSLMLFQNDDFSQECFRRKELNNWTYKRLLYALYPDFYSNFRLSGFNPDWEHVISTIQSMGLVEGDLIEPFISALASQARKYVCDNCFVDFRNIDDTFDHVADYRDQWKLMARSYKPLLGHMLHREIRNINPERYFDFFEWYEGEKARLIWNYWNKRNIAFPFNAIIPKGEIGLNPAMTRLKVDMFEGIPDVDGRDVYVDLGRPLDLRIGRRLGSLWNAFGRDRTGAGSSSTARPDIKINRLEVAIAIVIRGSDVLLVKRRVAEGDLTWQFPSGMVKPTSLPEEAARREVKKETNIVCEVVSEIGSRVHPTTGVLCYYYHCRYVSGEIENLDPEENIEVAWVATADIGRFITSDLYQPVADLLAHTGPEL